MSSVFVVREKRFTKYFYKNFACFAGKKHTLLHGNGFGGRIVFQKCDLLLAQVSISISILLFIIIIRHLQHKAS